MMVTERIRVEELQQELPELGQRIQGTRFIVEQNDEPIFVLLGYEDYEELMEIMAEQIDPEFQTSLRKARAEIEDGEGYSLEQVMQMIGEWEKEATEETA